MKQSKIKQKALVGNLLDFFSHLEIKHSLFFGTLHLLFYSRRGTKIDLCFQKKIIESKEPAAHSPYTN